LLSIKTSIQVKYAQYLTIIVD